MMLLFCGLFIYSACETDKGSNDPGTIPVSPTPPAVPAILNINYLFSGTAITTNQPLVLHIYNNKNNMTNQSNPLFVHSTIDTNDSITVQNIPAGTYYILIWRDGNVLGTLETCERYLIWTNFGWWPGQSVDATPIVVPAGTTINADVNVKFNNFKLWGNCPQ